MMILTDPNDRYARCEAQTLVYEGGYSDNPRDPGGPTNKGVTLTTLAQYLGRPVSIVELQNASPQLIAAVYRSMFWNPVHGDQLPAGVDMMMFDAAVNSGPGRSVEWAQTAVVATPDGSLGPVTLAAILAADPVSLIKRLSAEREHFLRSLPTFDEFEDGWIKRVDNVTALSLAWAQGA